MRWQIEDVRAVTGVASVRRLPVTCRCGLCERPFAADRWLSLSVARNGVGGSTVGLCQACAEANWEALLGRLAEVAEMLTVADELHSQAGV